MLVGLESRRRGKKFPHQPRILDARRALDARRNVDDVGRESAIAEATLAG